MAIDSRAGPKDKVTALSVRQLAKRVLPLRGADGCVGELLRRELEALDRDAAFSPGGRAEFQDLLATLGIATRRPIGVPLNDEPYSFRCGHPLAGYRSRAELAQSADVVIIGAGLTGVSAAYHLAEAASEGGRVVVLEQGDPAGEASGRNGGNFELLVVARRSAHRQLMRLDADRGGRCHNPGVIFPRDALAAGEMTPPAPAMPLRGEMLTRGQCPEVTCREQ